MGRAPPTLTGLFYHHDGVRRNVAIATLRDWLTLLTNFPHHSVLQTNPWHVVFLRRILHRVNSTSPATPVLQLPSADKHTKPDMFRRICFSDKTFPMVSNCISSDFLLLEVASLRRFMNFI